MKEVEKKKQISIVLETIESFDEIDLIQKIKKFLDNFKEVKIVGTHIKVLKPIDKRDYEKDIQSHNRP